MPRLILAGLPIRTLYSRDKSFQGYFETRYPEWNSTIAWSERRVGLAECMQRLDKLVNEADLAEDQDVYDGLHILAFDADDASRKNCRENLTPNHRVRFLSTTLMQHWGRPEFREAIDGAVAFETLWRRNLRPPFWNHPLLLPKPHFHTTKTFGRIWERSSDPESQADIEDISRTLVSFCERHHVNDAFEDLDYNRFEYNVERHGGRQGRDDWRFTYRMPDGFHYDVQPPNGKTKVVVSRRTFDRYVNAYPYGVLRGTEI